MENKSEKLKNFLKILIKKSWISTITLVLNLVKLAGVVLYC